MLYLIMLILSAFFFIFRRMKKQKWLLLDFVLLFMVLGTASDLFLLNKLGINIFEFWGNGKPPAEEVEPFDKLNQEFEKRM